MTTQYHTAGNHKPNGLIPKALRLCDPPPQPQLRRSKLQTDVCGLLRCPIDQEDACVWALWMLRTPRMRLGSLDAPDTKKRKSSELTGCVAQHCPSPPQGTFMPPPPPLLNEPPPQSKSQTRDGGEAKCHAPRVHRWVGCPPTGLGVKGAG